MAQGLTQEQLMQLIMQQMTPQQQDPGAPSQSVDPMPAMGRQARIDASQAAIQRDRGVQTPGSIGPTPGPGGAVAQEWASAPEAAGSDPMAQLAYRIGKLKGAKTWNRTQGTNSHYGAAMAQQQSAELEPLQELFAAYKKKMGVGPETSSTSQGGTAPVKPQRFGTGIGMAKQSTGAPLPERESDEDKLQREFREKAMKAAMRYMNVSNPHLVESLFKQKKNY